MWAVRKGEVEKIEAYFADGADPNEKEKNPAGRTLLGWASLSRQVGAMECLLKHGADVNIRDCSGFTPLNYIATFGPEEHKKEEIELLLAAGANVDQCDNRGFTPLMHAAIKGHCAALLALLAGGASLDCKEDHGHDAEAHARGQKHEDAASILADVRAAGGWDQFSPPEAE